jgi:hypothetical protein
VCPRTPITVSVECPFRVKPRPDPTFAPEAALGRLKAPTSALLPKAA